MPTVLEGLAAEIRRYNEIPDFMPSGEVIDEETVRNLGVPRLVDAMDVAVDAAVSFMEPEASDVELAFTSTVWLMGAAAGAKAQREATEVGVGG